jgi:penicillin V acylase-like amidase (Ntn superfamily)
MIKRVSILRGAYDNALGIETEGTWPTAWTTLADSVNRLYCFQSADSSNLLWLDFSRLDFSRGAPVKPVPGNDSSMNGELSARITVIK